MLASSVEVLGRQRLIDADIARYLDDLELLLADPQGPVRLDEHGELHLSPLAAAVVDAAVLAERDAVVARLPGRPLTELLIETDLEAHWSKHRTHAGGARPRVPELEHRRNLYAAILAQARTASPFMRSGAPSSIAATVGSSRCRPDARRALEELARRSIAGRSRMD